MDKWSYPQGSVDTVDNICNASVLHKWVGGPIRIGVIPTPGKGVSDTKLTGAGEKMWTTLGYSQAVDNLLGCER